MVVTVTNIDGEFVTGNVSVQVIQPGTLVLTGPTANPNPALVNQTITFNASVNQGPATWLWDFGDTTTSTLGNSVTHAYSAVNTYTVTVTATVAGYAPVSNTVLVNVAVNIFVPVITSPLTASATEGASFSYRSPPPARRR